MSMRKAKQKKLEKSVRSTKREETFGYSRPASLNKRLDPEDVEIYNNQWRMYKALEKQIEEAWTKLRNDVRQKASPQTIAKDKNHLLLLLGECNYMVRECARYTRND